MTQLQSSRFGGKAGNPTSAIAPGGQSFDFDEIPHVREVSESTHGEPDDEDMKRVAWAVYLWDSQDDSLRRRDRQIEENVRMLSGQQWSVFNPRIGRFVDVTRWMTQDEKKWRQRPVYNRLLPWFIITHARMTENPPIVTFVPGPDSIDSALASTLDVIFKTKWREIGMAEVWDRASAWLIPGGTVYLQSRIDLSKGKFVQFKGQPDDEELGGFDEDQQEVLRGLRDDGQEMPFDADGNLVLDEETGLPGDPDSGFFERKGDLSVEVLNPVQVRGEWGPNPWHEKGWHETRSFLTTSEIFEAYGIKILGNQVPNQGGSDTGVLERLTYGSGYFGAADPSVFGSDFSTNVVVPEPTVEVFTLWHKPAAFAGMKETPEEPGGRLLVCTRTQVLHDSTRPVRYPYTSPIRRFEFIRVPGRPGGGTTPQEAMNQPQRAYNKTMAGIQEHTNLSTNPIKLVDGQSGIEERQMTNRPGLTVKVNRKPGIVPFEWVSPPPLSPDSYRFLELMRNEIDELGALSGTEGESPTQDASGELVKELRFNSDRFLGPTMRRAAEEYGRLVEDWMQIIPVLYDEEQILSYAGDDNVAKTIIVQPEMFTEGSVNVVADVESMLPEGRGERQKNITALYANGLFGAPGTPQAVARFFELSQFPHLGRAGKFGGTHRVTADQENGKLLQGVPAINVPVLEWYDDLVHLLAHEEFMASPEFLDIDPVIQEQFALHRQMHIMQVQLKTLQAVEASVDGNPGPTNQFTEQPDPASSSGAPSGAGVNSAAPAVQPGSEDRQPAGQPAG